MLSLALVGAAQANEMEEVAQFEKHHEIGSKARLALALPGANEAVTPTHWSFGQLASLVGAPSAYLRQLPAPLAENWKRFIAGMTAHEKVHGDHIKEMVDRIIATTVGVNVPNDAGCRKIRQQLQGPLGEASLEQRARAKGQRAWKRPPSGADSEIL